MEITWRTIRMRNESGRYSAKNSSTVMPGHITLVNVSKNVNKLVLTCLVEQVSLNKNKKQKTEKMNFQ